MDPFCYLCLTFHFCLHYTVLSVPYNLVITCCKRTELLALLSVFVTFPYGVLGQVRYLIASIPDLYLLYFHFLRFCNLNVLDSAMDVSVEPHLKSHLMWCLHTANIKSTGHFGKTDQSHHNDRCFEDQVHAVCRIIS